MKFNRYMYVEVCKTVRGVKYIFKYIHKGNDAAHVEIRQKHLNHDEILQHVNVGYVGPHQTVVRFMRYKMHDKSHIIIRLAIHLPLQHNVYYQNGNEQGAVDCNQRTTLTAFFKLNEEDQNAYQYLYHESPENYTFHQRAKNGILDDNRLPQSSVEVIKFNPLILHKLLVAYSFYTEKE